MWKRRRQQRPADSPVAENAGPNNQNINAPVINVNITQPESANCVTAKNSGRPRNAAKRQIHQ